MIDDRKNTQRGDSSQEEISKTKRPCYMISSAKKHAWKRNPQTCQRKIMRSNQWRFKTPAA